jgi:hypothetical protein
MSQVPPQTRGPRPWQLLLALAALLSAVVAGRRRRHGALPAPARTSARADRRVAADLGLPTPDPAVQTPPLAGHMPGPAVLTAAPEPGPATPEPGPATPRADPAAPGPDPESDSGVRGEISDVLGPENLDFRHHPAPIAAQPAEPPPAIGIHAHSHSQLEAEVRPRIRLLARVRGMLWNTSVLIISAGVGLVLAAAIFALAHGSSPATRFADAASVPPGRFLVGAAISDPRLPAGASLVADVHGDRVAVYPRPDGRLRHHELPALTVGGKPVALVLLVARRRPGWLEVELPVRPNLSTGWIHAGDVTLHSDLYHVQADLNAHTLLVWRGTTVVKRVAIGVGASLSPTPSGRYFIADLLRPPDPGGLYGPYAFGLSAHSDVYTSFAGGDGQIGLHGTDDPAGLGHNVSHGCIRVANATITQLAKLLPLGTPVVIER